NVFRNRLRSLFALATIGMGAIGLLLFGGFNDGMLDAYRTISIRARFGHGEVMKKGYRGTARAKPWDAWIPDPEHTLARLRARPEVKDIFPRVTVAAVMFKEGEPLAAIGEGIDGVAED